MPNRRTIPAMDGTARIDPLGSVRDLLHWDPTPDFAGLRQTEAGFAQPFDIKEAEDAYIFVADLPGLLREELEIGITGTRLTVTGERLGEALGERENYYALERMTGRFRRTFNLPSDHDPGRITADLKRGVLTIRVSKTQKPPSIIIPIDE